MRGKLSEITGGNLFSPLIDVICNTMAAMFIFLILYIALVLPGEKPVGLRILNEEMPDAVWCEKYESGIAAAGGVGPYTFECDKDTLPDGVELDPRTGAIRGVPTPTKGAEKKAHQFEFGVRVRDGKRDIAKRRLKLNVAPVAVPFDPDRQALRLQVESERLPDAYVKRPYDVAVGILGGIEPYRVDLEGEVPPGLAWKDGRLFGTPTAVGDHTFTVSVRDEQDHYGILEKQGRPRKASRAYRLAVRATAELELRVVLPEGRVGEPYAAVTGANGGLPPYRWEISDGALAPGLTLDASCGTISGIPERSGPSTAIVVVHDSAGRSAKAEANLDVLPARPQAAVLTRLLPDGRLGQPYAVTLSCEGMVEPVKWSIADPLPPGLALEGATLSGTPTEARQWDLKTSATDARGKTATATHRIRVLPQVNRLQLVPMQRPK